MSDRTTFASQLEHFQRKYTGAGHADTTKHDWLQHQHRDTLASYVGHSHFLTYFSVANNESIGRVRYETLSKLYEPCGPSPEKVAQQQKLQQSAMEEEKKQ